MGTLILTTLFFGLINPKLIDLILLPPKHSHGHQHHEKEDNIDHDIDKINKELTGYEDYVHHGEGNDGH